MSPARPDFEWNSAAAFFILGSAALIWWVLQPFRGAGPIPDVFYSPGALVFAGLMFAMAVLATFMARYGDKMVVTISSDGIKNHPSAVVLPWKDAKEIRIERGSLVSVYADDNFAWFAFGDYEAAPEAVRAIAGQALARGIWCDSEFKKLAAENGFSWPTIPDAEESGA